MKEGWVVKKLGEVCDIYQPKTISTSALVENGKYLVYGANGVIGKYDQYNHTESELLMTCRGATCGTINISEPYSWINGNAMVIHPFEGNITMSYLKYVLRGIDLSNVITGAAQPQITRQSLSPLLIPIPSLSVQSRIVEELDLLSNIIEKKRQQLSELDNLAQSIFYDMFGDPVTNEKGWEVKLIGEISTFYNGKAHEKNIVEDSGFLLVNAKFISSCGDIKKYSDMQLFPLYKNDITMVMSDLPNGKTLAKCYLIEKDDTYTLNQRICAFRGYKQNPIFLKYVLNRNKYYLSFDDGNGQTNLRKSDVVNCPIILPPLSLQQLFAKKIEAIEQQKALIKQSITETEELFNCRMDYYFN